ncbi:MAG: YihY/virulence factor BrkB family protein, partial [Leptolyngbyaceae cyanobacterium SM2_5_2]|nr:YihY/virulence factor BrkB family protein [Leptolyngbyaceae cyanobacterium SM2_5_2]
IYQGAPSRRPGWVGKLWPWLLTGIVLLTIGLVGSLIGQAVPSTPGSSGAVGWLRWPGLVGLLRFLVSVGLTGLGVALVHRLSPRQWPSGCPLWPGVGLTVSLGLGVLALCRWGIGWVQSQTLAYGLFLTLGLTLMGLFAWLWLILAGAQFNIGAMSYRGGPGQPVWGTRTTPPPPSFESFKINR